MNVDRTTIKNSSLGEHHMVWNAKTKLYTDDLKYKVQAIWNIYLLDAVLPKEFSTVAVQEKKITGENAYYAHSKFLRNYILLSVNFHFILFSFVKTRANGRNIVGCYMLHLFEHLVACRWMLLRGCCVKFETGQTFRPRTPNVSFVPWSPKRSATMLDPFAQLFQHCWGHARWLRTVYKDLWVVSLPRCTAGPNIVESCCIRLHTTANTHATTPNIFGATMLRVVASVCAQPNCWNIFWRFDDLKQFLFRLKWDLTGQRFLVILNLKIFWWVLLVLHGFFCSLLNCKLAILPAI